MWVQSLHRGHSIPLQYSCLENPMEGGAWQATVHGVAKSQTQLKQHICIYIYLSDSALCSILWLILGMQVGLSSKNQKYYFNSLHFFSF